MGELIEEKSVIQANPLVESRKYMNLSELRIFCLGLQDVRPHIKDDTVYDIDFHETFISHKTLLNLFSDNPSGVEHLKKHIKKAFDGKIELKLDDKGSFMLVHIYKQLKYIVNEGMIIEFDPEMKPYILDLVGQAYTSYKLGAVFPLSSEYSWRLLELMLEKKGYLKKNDIVYRIMTIDDVKFCLNVPETAYKGRINNFRKYVLDEPIREINEKTDYFVWYEVQKTGRKVTGFKIWLKIKPTVEAEALEVAENTALPLPPAATAEKEREALKAAMLAEGMPPAAVNTWIKNYGVADAAASWRLALDHASKRTETMSRGEQRKIYLKSCMEKNIASSNIKEAEIKKEIDEREKRLAAEKKQRTKETQNFFAKITEKNEIRARGEMKTVGEVIAKFGGLTGPELAAKWREEQKENK